MHVFIWVGPNRKKKQLNLGRDLDQTVDIKKSQILNSLIFLYVFVCVCGYSKTNEGIFKKFHL